MSSCRNFHFVKMCGKVTRRQGQRLAWRDCIGNNRPWTSKLDDYRSENWNAFRAKWWNQGHLINRSSKNFSSASYGDLLRYLAFTTFESSRTVVKEVKNKKTHVSFIKTIVNLFMITSHFELCSKRKSFVSFSIVIWIWQIQTF